MHHKLSLLTSRFAGSLLLALVVGLAALAISPLALSQTAAQKGLSWVNDTFEDFKKGEFEASGTNLYATKKGTIKNINRFDFNGDGYLDLVFNTSQDEVKTPPATYFDLPTGRNGGRSVELPALGTSHAAVADLNKDGYPEAIVCPNADGVSIRRFMTIFWGGPDGWSERRMTGLITISPRSLQVADINGDGWLDILVLNGAEVLRIYWGSKDGFRQEYFRDISLSNAQEMKVGDLDGDGRPEIVVLQREPSGVLIFWNDNIKPTEVMLRPSRRSAKPREEVLKPARVALNSPSAGRLVIADYNADGRSDLIVTGGKSELIGRDPTTGEERYRYSGVLAIASSEKRQWAQPRLVTAPAASSIGVADLDKDGLPDLILTDSGLESESVRILWGNREGTFQSRPVTKLPVSYASTAAVTDLDGDGDLDLVAAVSRSKETSEGSSRIFWGDGKGGLQLASMEIPTADAVDIAVAPGVGGKGHRIIFCNNRAGRINEDVPVFVYWGSRGGFDPQRVSKYHIRSGYASIGADLNDDGYPDLALLSIVHAVGDKHPELGFNILWGGKDGLKDDRRAIVREEDAYGPNVADLNRDGYLDLISTSRATPTEPRRLSLWYGGPNGFDPKRRVTLPCEGIDSQNAVADFNKDGFLDIVVMREFAHLITIFWGGKDGFSIDRQSSVPMLSPVDVKTADLNKDGWLDLVVSSHEFYGEMRFEFSGAMEYDFGTYIYWGGPNGFSQANSQRLPAHSGIGITLADFDGDAWVDIYVPSYHFGVTRESIASYLYWNGPNGFSAANKTDLIVDGSHGSMAADFDGDGLIDLAVAHHTRGGGDHYTKSKVFYNDGHRFTHPRIQELPTIGPHHMQRMDVGSTYNRSYRETYVSSAFGWEQPETRGSLSVKAETPGKTRLEFSVRYARSKQELAEQPWKELGAVRTASFDISPTARFMQYRAAFVSDNGDRYPALDRVQIDFAGAPATASVH
jgi:hypothetical protein